MLIHFCVGVIAITVGLGGFGLYMMPFFFPEVYRKYDMTWSGVGTVYAIADNNSSGRERSISCINTTFINNSNHLFMGTPTAVAAR